SPMAASTTVRSPRVTTGMGRGLDADRELLPRHREFLACRHHFEACQRHHVACRHHAAVFQGAVRSDSALFVCPNHVRPVHPKGRR
ncbi:hypothetical protein ACFVUP_38090, partial [Streptomyces bacillaris]|uniref:hypothetical protein n=1 Tax=Streptomyces bacillaris TaxID=68179 RepID=UPI0036DECE9C